MPEVTNVRAVSQRERDAAALSYVPVLSVILLFLERHTPFIRFHARQGTLLTVMAVILWFIPYAGKPLLLVALAAVVKGFLNASAGDWRELPLIGPLSRGSVRLLTRL